MKNKTCCFTGHRNISPEQYLLIKSRLDQTLKSLIHSGYRYFGTGGALGFDTMAAQSIIELKRLYPFIRLILVLPCDTQADFWQPADREIYSQIKQRADKIVYTSHKYFGGCMMKRNRHLVDCSSVCVCYLTKESGGTAYTVNYARNQGVAIINIA